jgi:hypothetical protein
MAASKDPRLARAGVSGYKVYLHLRADTGAVFYVGKGTRWRENETRHRNQHWQRITSKYGRIVQIVASDLTNEEACLLEKELIKKIGRENLVNYTDGGEGSSGYSHTKIALLKMRGRCLSEDHKNNLSKAKLINPVRFWLGKNRSEQVKSKISESLSNPNRKLAETMLINGVDRKQISKNTGLSLAYLRGLASRMRKEGCHVEKQVN